MPADEAHMGQGVVDVAAAVQPGEGVVRGQEDDVGGSPAARRPARRPPDGRRRRPGRSAASSRRRPMPLRRQRLPAARRTGGGSPRRRTSRSRLPRCRAALRSSAPPQPGSSAPTRIFSVLTWAGAGAASAAAVSVAAARRRRAAAAAEPRRTVRAAVGPTVAVRCVRHGPGTPKRPRAFAEPTGRYPRAGRQVRGRAATARFSLRPAAVRDHQCQRLREIVVFEGAGEVGRIRLAARRRPRATSRQPHTERATSRTMSRAARSESPK